MTTSYRELHHKPTLNVLDKDQIEQIHLATMEVLERTGIRITHLKALELLDGAGATVDWNRVRIPAQLVEQAIHTSPSHFALGKRNGEPAIFLEDNKSYFGAGLDGVDYLNPITDERRRFSSEDCRVIATISNALSNCSWSMILGLLDHSAVISPNYLVLVDEILSMVNQYMRGILVNDETLALDLIDRVGPGGHYLEEEHTRHHFRDVWYSDLFDRTNYDTWLQQGSISFTERLKEKTLKLMNINPEPLPAEVMKEMDRMEKKWYRDSGH